MNFLKKNNRGDHPETFVSVSGEKVIPKYQGKVDKVSGQIELVEVGIDPWYERIQSYKDMCDVNRIVARYMNGEVDILNQVQGVYADVSAAPSDLASAYRLVKEQELVFDRLPIEVKEKFQNNPYVWMQSAGTDNWMSAMSAQKAVSVDEREDVITNES